MPYKPPPLFPSQTRLLQALGERLRMARLRRGFSVELVAQRCGVSRPTLNSVEKGSPSVTLGVYLRVLGALNMEKDLEQLAAQDPVGQRIRDAAISKPRRRRAPKRVVAQEPNAEIAGVSGAVDNWNLDGIERIGTTEVAND